MQLAAIEVAVANNVSKATHGNLPSVAQVHSADGDSHHPNSLGAHASEQGMSQAESPSAAKGVELLECDAKEDADPWGSLVDSESPSMPSSPRADASSPPSHTTNMLSSQFQGLMHAAQEPCLEHQPDQATLDQELTAQLSCEDTVSSQMPFCFRHHEDAEPGGRQHSAANNRVGWEVAEQQTQPVRAAQQLQRQLQQSQQHLLRCQESHKQRIATAFGQAVRLDWSDQLPLQKHSQDAMLVALQHQTYEKGSTAEQQEQQQKQQLESAKQAKHAQHRQRAGLEQCKPEHPLAKARAEAGCNSGANLANMCQWADMHPCSVCFLYC